MAIQPCPPPAGQNHWSPFIVRTSWTRDGTEMSQHFSASALNVCGGDVVLISAAWPEIFCSWSALCSVNRQLENVGNGMAGVFRIGQYKEEDVPLHSRNTA